jgi:nitrate reductase cytochrome c-type subunit
MIFSRKKFIILAALILLTLVLAGCGPAEVEIKEVEVTVVVEPTEAPPEPTAVLADQSAYHTAWEEGPHSTYDVARGPNDWCARCHSPQNWNPEATVGASPNCVSCKMFEEITVGDGNVLIEEEDWFAIPCETCHVMVDGFATEIAYLNPITMEYKAVSNSTELCEQCHVTTTGNAFGSAVDHKITLGGSAHLNYGGFMGDVAPPTFCADCHDPHTTEPAQCIDCHAEDVAAAEHAGGMYGVMKDTVTCMACHDASGADVGPHPDEDNDLWVPQVTTVGRGGPSTDAIVSHSIVFTVACDRCHYAENAWELTVLTASGAIPEPPAEE